MQLKILGLKVITYYVYFMFVRQFGVGYGIPKIIFLRINVQMTNINEKFSKYFVYRYSKPC